MTVLGAVVAGGHSRRFGSDKASAPWRGRALLDHAIETVRPLVDAVVVCGRDWPGEVGIADRPHADLGPLGGINAALAQASRLGFDTVLTVPCDAPSLPPALLRRLLAHRGAAFVLELPVIGVWPSDLASRLDAHLAAGDDRSVRGWARSVGAEGIATLPGETLANVNVPDDLAALAGERRAPA